MNLTDTFASCLGLPSATQGVLTTFGAYLAIYGTCFMPPGRKPAALLLLAGVVGAVIGQCGMRGVTGIDSFRFVVPPFCMALAMSVNHDDKGDEEAGDEAGYAVVEVKEMVV